MPLGALLGRRKEGMIPEPGNLPIRQLLNTSVERGVEARILSQIILPGFEPLPINGRGFFVKSSKARPSDQSDLSDRSEDFLKGSLNGKYNIGYRRGAQRQKQLCRAVDPGVWGQVRLSGHRPVTGQRDGQPYLQTPAAARR